MKKLKFKALGDLSKSFQSMIGRTPKKTILLKLMGNQSLTYVTGTLAAQRSRGREGCLWGEEAPVKTRLCSHSLCLHCQKWWGMCTGRVLSSDILSCRLLGDGKDNGSLSFCRSLSSTNCLTSTWDKSTWNPTPCLRISTLSKKTFS